MADELVGIAFRNWGPRFVIRGVDLGDVMRLAGSIREWDDSQIRRCDHKLVARYAIVTPGPGS